MQLLKIRYLQFRRDLGFWVILIALAAAYLSYLLVSDNRQRNLIITALVFIAFAGFQNKRRDLNFISHYFGQPRLQTAINYNLSLLPISLGFLFKGEWLYSLLLHLSISGLPFFKIMGYSPKLFFIRKFIPDKHFEWLSGIRANFPLLCLLTIAILFFSPVKLFAVVALFVFNTVFIGFYGFFEPRLMLNPESLPLKKFLSTKVNFFVKVILISNSPILVINSFFQPDAAIYNLFFLLGFILLAATSVYIKYATYKPNGTSGLSVDFLILIASIVLPYFLPLGIYIYYSQRKKAMLNLLNYLDDHD